MPTYLLRSPDHLFRRCSALVGLLAFSLPAAAATLQFEAPLRLRPDPSAPEVAWLPAGSNIDPLLREEAEAAGLPPLPPGWVAVRYSGTVNGYVRNEDVGKDFVLKPGAEIQTENTDEAPVITTIDDPNSAEVLGPAGRWCKVAVKKELILYLNSVPPGARAALAPPPAPPVTSNDSVSSTADATTSPAGDTADSMDGTDNAPAAASPAASPAGAPEAAMSQATPRTFVGFLSHTRRFLWAGPKLDYELVDENGRRIALLDLSALLQTNPISSFEGRRISVYGPGIKRPEVKDLIIHVETLRLAP